MDIFVIVFLTLLVAFLLYVGLTTYNKLNVLKRQIDVVYEEMTGIIREEFVLIGNILNTVDPSIDISEYREILKSYSIVSDPASMINCYIEMEAALRKTPLNVNMDEFNAKRNKISELRKDYNNLALAITNKTNSFPSNIFAKLFGFEQYMYFRSLD